MAELLDQLLKEDLILVSLLQESSLTYTQLDTLLSERIGREEGLSLSKRIMQRDKKGVKKGAYFRTLKQAQQNIRRSAATLLLTQYLGLIDPSSSMAILKAGEIIAELRGRPLEDRRLTEVAKIIRDLLDRVSVTQR